MLYRPSSSAKKSLASFAVAAAMLGTAFGFTAASAQDVASNSDPSSTCSQKFGPTDAGVRCAIRQMDKDIADAKARSAAAEKEIKEIKQDVAIADCVNFLTTGVKSGAFVKAEILQKAGGKLNDQNACPIAKSYGFGRKAESSASPQLN